MVTIKQAIEKGMVKLKSANLETPKLQARLLMQYVLKKDRQYIIVYDSKNLTKLQETKYFYYIKKLTQKIPLQHITHSQEFMKLNFYVDRAVLIPRPDTEILVEEVIEIAKKIKNPQILDLCTGSGAIAVSLAKYIDGCKITAVDISQRAINVAKKNAKTNNVENKITFVKSDLFNDLNKEKYDIIVSNPPYIKKEVLKTLDKQVKKEPQIALDGGIDGLQFYRKIISNTYNYLKYDGYLCLEIGYDQKEEVEELLKKQDKFSLIKSKKDLYNNDRIVCAKLGK